MKIPLKSKSLFLACLFWYSAVRLFAADAPVTTTGNVTNSTPGTAAVIVPVTVSSFTNIGQFTLTMTFDIARVQFVSVTTNPALTGMSVTYTNPTGTQGKIVFSWTGAIGTNVSLADGSTLAGLTFSYLSGTGILSWSYNYDICRYKRYDGATLTLLTDSPKYLFYKNGGISNRSAPVTIAPTIAVTATGPISIPITVNGFSTIGALTLNLEYDPAIITYQNTFTKNAVFGSTFLVGNVAGTGGKKVIVIQWYGGSVNLADGSTLCTLNFTYPNPSLTGCALTWLDSGPSCEYTDWQGDVLIDIPGTGYYVNGRAAPPLVGVSVMASANPICVTTPVTYTSTPTNGGTSPVFQWKVNGSNVGTNTTTYTYVPANNDVITCVLTSSATFVSGNPATSAPVTMAVYSQGAMVADFTANKLAPPKNETVLLTDLSTGGPNSWLWSFDRPTVAFVNGTSASSQNPQVQFTDGGLYTVSLTVSSSCDTDGETKSGFLRAGISGLWSGSASGEWSVPSNWDNDLVPGSTTAVVIPASASHWPVFTGDLTIGVHCLSLTLNGATSQMTVNGNLVIP
jgi:PKD repeat protein